MRIQMALALANANYFTACQLPVVAGTGRRPEQDSQDSLSRNALAAPWRCNSSCRVKLATIKWSKLINFALCAASQTDWHAHTHINLFVIEPFRVARDAPAPAAAAVYSALIELPKVFIIPTRPLSSLSNLSSAAQLQPELLLFGDLPC